jgi:hypothetical protein
MKVVAFLTQTAVVDRIDDKEVVLKSFIRGR